MTDERLGPDDLSTRGVPSARRGYDKRVIDALFAEAARHWRTLEAEHKDLRRKVEESGGLEFIGREMSEVAREVGAILESAKEAADGMRSRAQRDAEQVEAESTERSAEILEEAEAQAFQMRQDAWETGTEVLFAALDEAAALVAGGKEDALLIRAQAEQESHRLISNGKKEGDDLIRSARYEADRMLNQAREIGQQIIDRASAPLEELEDGKGASEDVEGRRRELLAEIEQLRSQRAVEAVDVFETAPEPTGRRAPEPEVPDPDGIDLSDELAAEVERLRGSSEPDVVQIRTNEPVQFGTEDDVGTLFEALRTPDETEPGTDSSSSEQKEPLSADPFELREQLVLPVINPGAREVKRRVVDLQNVALDGLRGGGWEPHAPTIARELRHALDTMIHKSASAGATAAGPLAGVSGATSSPGERANRLTGEMAAALVGSLAAALEEGTGPEIQAAAVSRVFRDWRTDRGERWVRRIALAAYHDSLLAALAEGGVDQVVGVSSGPGCSECPARDGVPWVPGGPAPNGTSVPPARLDCACSFIPALG